MSKSTFLARMLKRVGYEPMRKRNLFVGALASRLTSDWNPYQASPTQELSGALATLRTRARDLERNNPLVRRYLNLLAENVVGHKGIRLQARNAAQANKAIEAAFCEWHQPAHCTVEGRLSWVGFQQAAIRSVARDGEAFIRVVEHQAGYGFALQLIDPDLVDESYTVARGETGNPVKLGVEVDSWGRPLAYHVFTEHQYDLAGRDRKRQRIPAAEILHLFIPRRPGQVRGESWLAPVLVPLRHLDGYAEAELVAARTAAAKMGFIVPGEDAEGPDPDQATASELEASPGVIDRLAKGETFQAWDPTHPSGNFGAFVTEVGRFIAQGLNVSYASLTGNLREVNFSSSRIGLLQERDAWRSLQMWLIAHLHEPVYTRWREAAWRLGHLSLRMAPSEYTDHVWQPRGWAYTNPQQEQMADMMACAAGFTSPQRVVGENGDDFEEILDEIAAAQQMAEAKGVELLIPNQMVSNDPGSEPGATDPDADGGSSGAGDAGRGRAHPRVALVRSAR